MAFWARMGKRLREAFAALVGGLSGRLLLLTVGFVLVSEVLVYAPSLARYYDELLAQRLAAAQIAVLAIEEQGREVSPELRRELLANAGVSLVAMRRNDQHQLFLADETPRKADVTYDLRDRDFFDQLLNLVDAIAAPSGRFVRVQGVPRLGGGQYIEVIMDEAPLRAEFFAYARRVFFISLAISLLAAALVYLSVRYVFVRPIQRLSTKMLAFRKRPEDARSIMTPSGRADEIGQAETTLAEMQTDLRAALHQKAHLAALGTAVAKINHDLKNMLTSAQLASDRLAASDDPEVKKLGQRLVGAIDRAVALAANTLKYGKAEGALPRRDRFALKPFVAEMASALSEGADGVRIENRVEHGLVIDADRDQLYRMLSNLARNAVQVMEAQGAGRLVVGARRANGAVTIDVIDTGPGIPDSVRAKLFEPFAAPARPGGTGLGLAIAKELAMAHGGDIALVETGPSGTFFRIVIPDREQDAAL